MNFKHKLLTLLISVNVLSASGLDALLEEYEISADSSNKTVNEKIGHVTLFTEQELRQMQYKTLSDVLKGLHWVTSSYNTYGTKNVAFAAKGGSVNTGIRVYINDHEVSSVHTLSPFLTWDDMPLDFISHIEVYNGDSSFRLGSEPGLTFVRVYTKSPKKENGGMFQSSISNKSNGDISIGHSAILDNKWSYLAYGASKVQNQTQQYKGQTLFNDYKRRYAYLDLNNEMTYINFGYADLKKDNFKGMSKDSIPDSGDIESRDTFLTLKQYYGSNKSLSVLFSVDINDRKYEESNKEGILVLPVINPANALSTPKMYKEDLTFTKYTAAISKEYNKGNHHIVTTFSAKRKDHDTNGRTVTTLANTTTYDQKLSDFQRETIYSFGIEDSYSINDKTTAIFNIKVDKYNRDSKYLEDDLEKIYRVGGIYTPTKELGFKTFYTSMYIPQSFYQVDFMDKSKSKLESQEVDSLTFETLYTKGKSSLSVLFTKNKIDNRIMLTTKGFANVDRKDTGDGMKIDYNYKFDLNNNLNLSWYHSDVDFEQANSASGGLVKYYGKYGKYEYFSSLIFKKGYSYNGLDISNGYDLNLGATYYLNKNLSVSVKGENVLNKALRSLQQDYTSLTSPTSFTLENEQREIIASIKWMF